MPLLEFSCSKCLLLFEARVKRGHGDTHPCKQCGSEAQRKLVVRTAATSSSKKELNPNLDRVIGRDAQKRWEEYKVRLEAKQSLAKSNPNSTVVKDKDGSYSLE